MTTGPDKAEDEQGADALLVERSRSGDTDAFAKLVDRYQQRVFWVARGMLGNDEDARDAAQEAFIRVYRSLERFDLRLKFYTWLYQIVVNLCIDARRKRARSRTDPIDETTHEDADHASTLDVSPWRPGTHPAQNAQNRELAGQIQKALDKLSDNHRRILVLREVDGLSYEELAELLGISKGTVMSRLFHARQNMQKMLRNELSLLPGELPDGKDGDEDEAQPKG
jgi:RNA polymerase sigma-70 factor (ECF subfamily)